MDNVLDRFYQTLFLHMRGVQKGKKCHPTWVPSTLGVNRQRLGTFLQNFPTAHASCPKGTEMSSHMGTLNSWSKQATFGTFLQNFPTAHASCPKGGQKCHPTWVPSNLGETQILSHGCHGHRPSLVTLCWGLFVMVLHVVLAPMKSSTLIGRE